MAQRGPYKKYPAEVRNAVLDVAENGGNWQLIAETLHIPYRTAHGWLQRMEEPPRPRGGDRRSKLNAQQVDTILTWLETNCQLTLEAIRDRLEVEFGVSVSPHTVSRQLDARLMSVKKVHYCPLGMNSLVNRLLRQVFVGSTLMLMADGKYFVYVDETNYNLFCRRTIGRARRGLRAVVKRPNSKGPNLHIVCGISSTGVVLWERQRGSLKIPNFNAWLRRCLQAAIAADVNPQDIVVVIDNAPAHSRAEEVFQEEAFLGAQVLRLGPYSPMLNPVEIIWSAVKTRLKARLQDGFNELVAGDPAGLLTQSEFRLRYMEHAVDMVMPFVIPAMCAAACNHVQQHYEAAIMLEDMPVGE